MIWVYGLFWIVYVILLDINVGLILLDISVFDQNSFFLDFRVGDFTLMVCCVVWCLLVATSQRCVDINKN